MAVTPSKIPRWKMVSLATASYATAVLVLALFTQTVGYWTALWTTPRFRTAFIFYSLPFLGVGGFLVALGGWLPNRVVWVIVRRTLLVACLVTLALACFFMVTFGLAFDWKMMS